MKVRLYSVWVNHELPGIWSSGDWGFTYDLPDGARVVGCLPSSIGYELVLMEEITDE